MTEQRFSFGEPHFGRVENAWIPENSPDDEVTTMNGIDFLTAHKVLEFIKSHAGCHRVDIATSRAMSCADVREVVVALSALGLCYQNQETLEHFSIVDGWAR